MCISEGLVPLLVGPLTSNLLVSHMLHVGLAHWLAASGLALAAQAISTKVVWLMCRNLGMLKGEGEGVFVLAFETVLSWVAGQRLVMS
jgi:hypothetical protein